jgi:methionine-S-sulfoxide reductase
MFKRIFLSAVFLLVLQSPVFAGPGPKPGVETAILAGGCFWCIEADYEKLDGVLDVVSGYTGGQRKNPTYKQVSSGTTGHIEAVKVSFDPGQISYGEILDYFWRHVDPTRDDGQFCDRGSQYRPAIFYNGEAQQREALASEQRIAASKPFPEPLKVELIAASEFYPAEEYHQDYYQKNPIRYKFYRYNCGRDQRVEMLWGKPVLPE